ncbi:MAG: hypothetical protein LV479_10735 [Methylacidiphilales bacterium]|nr:hypothetical protein [Candidatus Methylacidiphilales bacterium]
MKPIPPEQWPEWREEQKRKDHSKGGLIGWIDRCLDDGVIIFSKRTILDFAKGDLEIAASCIKEWETAGILEVLKPLNQATDQENVIKMKKFIARASDSYPGNWPFEKRPISN